MADEATMVQQDTVTEETEGAGEKLVPVNEAIRYRKRAQAAEQRVQQLQEAMTQTESQLDEARQVIDHLEQRRTIDELLAHEEAADLEVARLLTEAAVAGMDEPDVKLAVQDLKRQKPYLFRRRPSESAAQAAVSGDRRDLLRYLRLRRGG